MKMSYTLNKDGV